MTDELKQVWKNRPWSNRGTIKAFPEGAEETHEKKLSQYPGRDSKRAPPEYIGRCR
jgi:hypothetical protein